jgi:hypothetical protein
MAAAVELQPTGADVIVYSAARYAKHLRRLLLCDLRRTGMRFGIEAHRQEGDAQFSIVYALAHVSQSPWIPDHDWPSPV